MTLEMRSRSLDECGAQVRAAASDNGSPVFTGHAAVFDSRTAIGNPLSWGWYEEIASGAFSKTLQEGDARFLVDHDTSMLLARVSAGDLRLAEDSVGLDVEADLDTELSYARDLVRNLERRRITGMSFGFRVTKDEWSQVDIEAGDQTVSADLRVIREVQLFEVSAVTFPAYEATDAGLRSVAETIKSSRLSPVGLETVREPGESTHVRDLAVRRLRLKARRGDAA